MVAPNICKDRHMHIHNLRNIHNAPVIKLVLGKDHMKALLRLTVISQPSS